LYKRIQKTTDVLRFPEELHDDYEVGQVCLEHSPNPTKKQSAENRIKRKIDNNIISLIRTSSTHNCLSSSVDVNMLEYPQ